MIVNNVTDMETETESISFFYWFFLFPVNKYNHFFTLPEWLVALIIFAATSAFYGTFVVCTIGQITEFLDIHCLSIKKKTTSEASTSASAKKNVASSEKQESQKEGDDAKQAKKPKTSSKVSAKSKAQARA